MFLKIYARESYMNHLLIPHLHIQIYFSGRVINPLMKITREKQEGQRERANITWLDNK